MKKLNLVLNSTVKMEEHKLHNLEGSIKNQADLDDGTKF